MDPLVARQRVDEVTPDRTSAGAERVRVGRQGTRHRADQGTARYLAGRGSARVSGGAIASGGRRTRDHRHHRGPTLARVAAAGQFTRLATCESVASACIPSWPRDAHPPPAQEPIASHHPVRPATRAAECSFVVWFWCSPYTGIERRCFRSRDPSRSRSPASLRSNKCSRKPSPLRSRPP